MISARHGPPSPVGSWNKSSYSGYNSNCVEVAQIAKHVAVRDSKAPYALHLEFDRAAWAVFLSQTKLEPRD
ncbi:hypothetical protein F4561_003090 [Lipingzhangella halophila]|uniref:DUF397 domain-containing protein n=1 Tax=Lipingzhangella halophila TaxID=1783352 RepID=A0A7W7RI07_9ACTN|nr:DUF397 domain-containing protein [Lipingzhangella halophila]MBB4932270.1 hypothetical protein [Lipingzhangella halophila]